MRKEIVEFYGSEKTRITKNQASKLFEECKTIYLAPCNANVNHYMINSLPIQKEDGIETDFDKRVNNYEYYNCNKELGTYAKYYVSSNLIK